MNGSNGKFAAIFMALILCLAGILLGCWFHNLDNASVSSKAQAQCVNGSGCPSISQHNPITFQPTAENGILKLGGNPQYDWFRYYFVDIEGKKVLITRPIATDSDSMRRISITLWSASSTVSYGN